MNRKLLIWGFAGIIMLNGIGCTAKKQAADSTQKNPQTAQTASNNTTTKPEGAHPKATDGVSEKSTAGDMGKKVESIINKKFPGEWSVKEKQLKKGDYEENNQYGIADEIASNFKGCMVSIYVGDERVSSTLKSHTGSRMITGYPVPVEVIETLEKGTVMSSMSEGPNKRPYQKFYIPIKQSGKTVGVIGISNKVN